MELIKKYRFYIFIVVVLSSLLARLPLFINGVVQEGTIVRVPVPGSSYVDHMIQFEYNGQKHIVPDLFFDIGRSGIKVNVIFFADSPEQAHMFHLPHLLFSTWYILLVVFWLFFLAFASSQKLVPKDNFIPDFDWQTLPRIEYVSISRIKVSNIKNSVRTPAFNMSELRGMVYLVNVVTDTKKRDYVTIAREQKYTDAFALATEVKQHFGSRIKDFTKGH